MNDSIAAQEGKQGITRLLEVMRRLRDPQEGCPWDREQSFASIAPYTLEEAYEVVDAIHREDWHDLKGELGDLLFQVVFYAQMAEEKSWYDFDTIAAAMADKLERRHPHVFAQGQYQSHAQLHSDWEARKADERKQRATRLGENGALSVLADVPLALPALKRAQKLQKRAASLGFDWPEISGVWDKLEEEISELKQAIEAGKPQRVADEIGDVLFTLVNLSRHLQHDAEHSLKLSADKFSRRFQMLEALVAAQGAVVSELSADELDVLWRHVKQE